MRGDEPEAKRRQGGGSTGPLEPVPTEDVAIDRGGKRTGSLFQSRSALRAGALVVLALALLRCADSLDLPFLLDDYSQLARPWSDLWLPNEPLAERYLYRPVLWSTFFVLRLISGEPLDPMVFRVSGLLLHLLALVLVVQLAQRFCGARAALGAGLFAACSGLGLEAVYWISAWGDVLSTIGLLLAALAVQRADLRPTRAASLAGCALAFAIGAKDTCIVFAPPLAAWLGMRLVRPERGPVKPERPPRARRFGRALALLAIFALAPMAMWALRSWMIGNITPRYAGGTSLPIERWLAVGSELEVLLAALVRPHYLDSPLSARPWFAASGALLLCGLIVATSRAPRWTCGWIAFALAGSAPFLAGQLLVADGSDRVLYPLRMIMALGLGVALQGAIAPGCGRLRRGAVVAATAIALGQALWTAPLCARAWSQAGLEVNTRIHAARALLAGRPAGLEVIAIDGTALPTRLPTIGGDLIGAALKPPFGVMQAHWSVFSDEAQLVREGALIDREGPILVARYAEGRFHELGPILPPRPRQPVTLIDEGSGRGVRLQPPIPARAIRAVSVQMAAGAASSLRLVFETSTGPRDMERQIESSDRAIWMTWRLPEDLVWPFAGVVERLRVLDLGARAVLEVEVHTELAELEILEPSARSALPVAVRPRVVVRGASADQRLAFEFRLRRAPLDVRFRHLRDASELGLIEPGVRAWVASPADRIESGWADLSWLSLPRHFRREVEGRGLAEFDLELRVLSYDRDGALIGRSPWQQQRLIR